MVEYKNILICTDFSEDANIAFLHALNLAKKYGAKLHILHIIHDPFNLNGWNLPAPAFNDEYKKMADKARKELDHMIQTEKAEGLAIEERIESGEPADEIQKVVESENIDLILMLAHKEGRFEHFLFGKTNDAIIRRLPATLMLVK